MKEYEYSNRSFETRVINGNRYFRYSYWDRSESSEKNIYSQSLEDLLTEVKQMGFGADAANLFYPGFRQNALKSNVRKGQ